MFDVLTLQRRRLILRNNNLRSKYRYVLSYINTFLKANPITKQCSGMLLDINQFVNCNIPNEQ